MHFAVRRHRGRSVFTGYPNDGVVAPLTLNGKPVCLFVGNVVHLELFTVVSSIAGLVIFNIGEAVRLKKEVIGVIEEDDLAVGNEFLAPKYVVRAVGCHLCAVERNGVVDHPEQFSAHSVIADVFEAFVAYWSIESPSLTIGSVVSSDFLGDRKAAAYFAYVHIGAVAAFLGHCRQLIYMTGIVQEVHLGKKLGRED